MDEEEKGITVNYFFSLGGICTADVAKGIFFIHLSQEFFCWADKERTVASTFFSILIYFKYFLLHFEYFQYLCISSQAQKRLCPPLSQREPVCVCHVKAPLWWRGQSPGVEGKHTTRGKKHPLGRGLPVGSEPGRRGLSREGDTSLLTGMWCARSCLPLWRGLVPPVPPSLPASVLGLQMTWARPPKVPLVQETCRLLLLPDPVSSAINGQWVRQKFYLD